MNGPRASQLGIMDVPALTPNNIPATIIANVKQETRAAITNTGVNTVFLAHQSSSLSNQAVVSDCYPLLPGKDVVIVISKDLGLYASGIGAGGTIGFALSFAFEGPGFGA